MTAAGPVWMVSGRARKGAKASVTEKGLPRPMSEAMGDSRRLKACYRT